jgi:general secretion pathway protein M
LIADPLMEQLDRLERKLVRLNKSKQEIARLAEEHQVVFGQLTRLEERMGQGGGGGSLLSFVETSATLAEVRQHISAMQPQESTVAEGYRETSVEVRLEGVQLPQLLALLSRLENAPQILTIKRVQVKPRYDQPHVLEAILLISSYEKV